MYIRLFMDRAKSSAFIEKLKDKALPLMCKAFGLAEQDKAKRYVLEFYISGVVPVISSWMNRQDISEESLAEMINGILHEGIISQLKQ